MAIVIIIIITATTLQWRQGVCPFFFPVSGVSAITAVSPHTHQRLCIYHRSSNLDIFPHSLSHLPPSCFLNYRPRGSDGLIAALKSGRTSICLFWICLRGWPYGRTLACLPACLLLLLWSFHSVHSCFCFCRAMGTPRGME